MNSRAGSQNKNEDWEAEIVRQLMLPDDRPVDVLATRLVWANYDIALEYGPLSETEISQLAEFCSVRRNLPLGIALNDILIPLRKHANTVLDRRIAKDKLRRALLTDFRCAVNGLPPSRH